MVGIEIDGRYGAAADLGDQLAHLQTPVAQVHVARDFPTIGAVQALEAIADNGRAQMAHMHCLGDVGPAEIYDEHLARAGARRTEAPVLRELRNTLVQRGIGYVDIDESRSRDFDFREYWVRSESSNDAFGERPRIGLRLLRSGERTVALKLGEIGSVGDGNRS